jgi:DNA-binding MarR family transcriptional regulator
MIKKTDIQNPNDFFFGIEKFIHEPSRLQILSILSSVDKADMIFLRNQLQLTWGNISFHATKLEEKAYISIEKTILNKKTYTVLQITELGLKQLRKYRKAINNFLDF